MMILTVALSAALTFVLTPTAMDLGWHLRAVDVPADGRRMHRRRIPRSGGIALLFGWLLSCGALCLPSPFLSVALGGAVLIFLLGLTDDILCLGPWCKLFFQTAIGLATVLGCGARDVMGTAGGLFWVLVLTNAHNFIDGLDGLLAGTVALEATGLALLLGMFGEGRLALPMLALASVCLGFRLYNRHPARIFAGDCGSGMLGFLLGIFSLRLWDLLPRGIAGASVLFLFAYPLTDLFCAVLRRMLRGKSPFTADRGHLHHRIFDAGVPHSICVRLLHGICGGTVAIGVLLGFEADFSFAGMLCFAVAALLMCLRRFIVEFAEKG